MCFYPGKLSGGNPQQKLLVYAARAASRTISKATLALGSVKKKIVKTKCLPLEREREREKSLNELILLTMIVVVYCVPSNDDSIW